MLETLTGPNAFERQQALRKRVEAFVEQHGEFAYELLDGAEVNSERMQEAITSLPFLATEKLVVLLSPGTNKQFQEFLTKESLDLPETTTALFIEPNLDKRANYYKWLKANTKFVEYQQLDERKLTQWTVEFAKTFGVALGSSDARYLVQRIGIDQLRLASEIEKLSLAGDATISRHDIDKLTEPTPQSKIFDLLEAAFNGRADNAMKLYDEQRAQKVEPQEIIAMLGWQLRQIALAKAAGTKHDLVREAKISPYGATKAKRIADQLSLEILRGMLATITNLDAKSKRQTVNLDQALRTFILDIAVS